jgi:hypothetical protein
MTKSRRMRWVGLATRIGEIRKACRILVGRPEGKDHSVDLDVDEEVITLEK